MLAKEHRHPRTTGQTGWQRRASCLHPACSVSALCIAGFRSEQRLQHQVSLAQSARLVLRSLLVCEVKLFKIHIDFLELLICLNLSPNELGSHND